MQSNIYILSKNQSNQILNLIYMIISKEFIRSFLFDIKTASSSVSYGFHFNIIIVDVSLVDVINSCAFVKILFLWIKYLIIIQFIWLYHYLKRSTIFALSWIQNYFWLRIIIWGYLLTNLIIHVYMKIARFLIIY